jgi:hypothetical protein
VRQYRRSPAAQDVIRLCDAVRVAAEEHGIDGNPNEMAALIVVEDATMAVMGYEASPPFLHVDEAYLAKYGLLQGLQAGFDAAEAVGRSVGMRIRGDKVPGGKAVLVTRNIVAGQPVGGTMEGQTWHHVHDRQTVHNKSVIRVMSFSRRDPDQWTGQTVKTEDLIADGLAVIAELLRRAVAHLSVTDD